MAKIWTVRCTRDISPSTGIVKGLTVTVQTQQACKDWPSLRQALADKGLTQVGGCLNDAYWEWT